MSLFQRHSLEEETVPFQACGCVPAIENFEVLVPFSELVYAEQFVKVTDTDKFKTLFVSDMKVLSN